MDVKEYMNEHRERMLEELLELLRIPSISADPAYAEDTQRCAEVVAEHLRKAGADNVEVVPPKGYPVVYGEKLVDPSKPTVLVYGHYDVQPADPIELWDSPAFEPVIKKTELHPEGAILPAALVTTKDNFHAREGLRGHGGDGSSAVQHQVHD